MPLTPGSTFERYEIQSLIGRGGMGEVYRAIDTRLHRPVALKVLRTDKDAEAAVAEAGGVQRLLREARAAAALNHANSVAIYELGEAEGIAYIAMELVTGMTLRTYLGTDGNVSVDTKVTWLVDAARALWAAHKAGLVHRDVKPGNIMVSEEGVVKVLDFGLAKAVTKKDPAAFQTLLGQVLGTPRYMAPEQLEGSPVDAAADQFAFGLTAYELISGSYPGGPLAGAPASLDTMVPGVSSELAQTITRMMARDPQRRFPTMEAAAHALRSCASSMPLQIAPAGSATSEARHSEHPTVVQPQKDAEPASVSREIPVHHEGVIEKGKTLPLGLPMQMAIGDGSASQHASQALDARNRTLPIARSLGASAGTALPRQDPSVPPAAAGASGGLPQERCGRPFLPGADGAGMNPTSGVYPSHAQGAALAAARAKRAAITAQVPRRSSSSWLAIAAVALVAVLAGAIAAWMFH